MDSALVGIEISLDTQFACRPAKISFLPALLLEKWISTSPLKTEGGNPFSSELSAVRGILFISSAMKALT